MAIKSLKPLREELREGNVESELINLVSYMLVPDIEGRRLPEEVLDSKEWANVWQLVKAAKWIVAVKILP